MCVALSTVLNAAADLSLLCADSPSTSSLQAIIGKLMKAVGDAPDQAALRHPQQTETGGPGAVSWRSCVACVRG